jgi:hypothetical protein
MILALILYLISGVFVWFFLGEIAFKVDPNCAIIIFSLLTINFITKQILLNGGKKNEK